MSTSPPKRVRIRPLADLGDRLGAPHDQTLADIADAIVFAEQDRHDHKRSFVGRPLPPPGAERGLDISYRDPNGALAQHWGIGAEALAFLDYAEAAKDPSIVMSDVFTVMLGSDTVWGNAETGYFLDVADPWTVYR